MMTTGKSLGECEDFQPCIFVARMYHLSLCNSFPGGIFGASLLYPSVVRQLSAVMMIAIATAAIWLENSPHPTLVCSSKD